MMNKDTFAARQAWRLKLKVGDLVMMKHGGMALITKVRHHTDEWFEENKPPSPHCEMKYVPHIEMIYCNDGEHASCSAYRIEEVLSEAR